MIKKILFLLIPILLVSCTSHKANTYGKIDNISKTISMPITNRYVSGDLKDLFRLNGYKIIIKETGMVSTKGTYKDTIDLNSNIKSNARYEMYIAQYQFDICLVGGPALDFEVIIVDNQSGEQVFYAVGRDCQGTIKKKLKKDLYKFF